MKKAHIAYENANLEKDRYIYTVEKYSKENKRLKAELNSVKTSETNNESKHLSSMKLSKENADLKVELRKVNMKLESLNETHEKECKQIRVNYEVHIDDLEQELNILKEKISSVENAEAITQKLAYWKEKAKNEARKLEKIEKEVIQFGDKTLMNKLFGGK